MDIPISLADFPRDITETIFEQAVQPPSKYHVSVRTATRCFEASQLIFVSKPFSICFFDSVKVLILNQDFNYFIDTANKLYSLLQRCQRTLTQLSLQSFSFSTLTSKKEENARPPKPLSFPSLEVLNLENCHPLVTKYLLLSINGDRLHTMRLTCELHRFEPPFIWEFFSEQLFEMINEKFGKLINLELICLSILPGFIDENIEYPLLERLESLSLIDLKFDNDVDVGKFLGIFQSQCKQLSVLNLRLQEVEPAIIVNTCIGLKNTLRKLHLLSHDAVWGVDESPLLTDNHALQIIDNCKNLVSLHISRNDLDNTLRSMNAPLGVPSDRFLTAFWVTHATKMLGTQLEHIGMAHLTVRTSVFQNVGDQCLDLRSINMRKCNMLWPRFSEFKRFFKRRGPKLESVDVTGCIALRDRHLSVLNKYLSCSVLKTLRIGMLSNCYATNILKKLLRRKCNGLETLELHGTARSVSVPISILEIIENTADKDKLKRVVLERPTKSVVYRETLKKMEQVRNKFPELLLRLKLPRILKEDEFFV